MSVCNWLHPQIAKDIMDNADALLLLETYSSRFEESKKLPGPWTNPSYTAAIEGTVNVLSTLFGAAEGDRFREHIRPSMQLIEAQGRSKSDLSVVYQSFVRHIDTCIAMIEVYRDKIQYLSPGKWWSDWFDAHIHPTILAATRSLFLDGHYSSAIENACKALDQLVRERSGRNDLTGTSLMQKVFSKDTPLLRFNDLSTESDKSEQQGMMFVYSGVMSAFRNPRAHGLIEDEMETAVELLLFISFLSRRLDHTIATQV